MYINIGKHLNSNCVLLGYMEEFNERDGNLDKPQEWMNPPRRKTTAEIDNNLWILAKQNLIGLKDAFEFGIKFMLAETGNFDYPSSKLLRKVTQLREALEKESQKNESKEEDGEDFDKEINNIVGGK